ncbi:hypothetical protein SAMN04488030_1613 [Aliiroseovarius halocynthiae]|uniref:Uncharacterized protein n=1 Tax=Aliiroseovarius halocynthiae TaxID=985055 RepID=A0A545SWY4_9RHOB|nr:hypothetical protein [Aliiroseovarius halocynthiae]TQV69470.1 hypothetical protein FIL88_07970 [Aliiroseovarius halocynthiae]SMR72868.1 hypothetical protein SAMN04488030_1613 [Aliiroseovarius halocynthiae]
MIEPSVFLEILIFPLSLPIPMNLLISSVLLAKRQTRFFRLAYYSSAICWAYLASVPLLSLATEWSASELSLIYPKLGLSAAFVIGLLGLFAPLIGEPRKHDSASADDFQYFWPSTALSILLISFAASFSSLQPQSPSLKNGICNDGGKQLIEAMDANLPDVMHDIEANTGKRLTDLLACS